LRFFFPSSVKLSTSDEKTDHEIDTGRSHTELIGQFFSGNFHATVIRHEPDGVELLPRFSVEDPVRDEADLRTGIAAEVATPAAGAH
jgi:hypothetical protein